MMLSTIPQPQRYQRLTRCRGLKCDPNQLELPLEGRRLSARSRALARNRYRDGLEGLKLAAAAYRAVMELLKDGRVPDAVALLALEMALDEVRDGLTERELEQEDACEY